MNSRSSLLLALPLVAACGGSAATSSTTPASDAPTATTHCVPTSHTDGTATLSGASLHERFALILPGGDIPWQAGCLEETEESSVIYQATFEGQAALLELSVESFDAPTPSPFDERAFLADLARQMTEPNGSITSVDDLGVADLRNGHVAWIGRFHIETESGPLVALDAYSVRVVADGRIVAAHSSAVSENLDEANARAFVVPALELFGDEADFARLEAAHAATPTSGN